jgi:hypothetical protein
MIRTLAVLALLSSLPQLSAAEAPIPRLRAQTIDSTIQIGYGLAIADVDGDKLPDILLADARQIVWYRAPRWEKFVIAENLTARDHVCIAAQDLDGDGKAEVAVGAEWNPNDTTGSGAIFLLEPPTDRTQRWSPRRLPHVPTTHRMLWVRGSNPTFSLAVLPLHGRGNRNGTGEGVEFLAYEWPWRASSKPAPLWTEQTSLHLTHNLDLAPAGPSSSTDTLLVATKEGIRTVPLQGGRVTPGVVSGLPAGEIRHGNLADGTRFIATIEPMHGNTLAVYRAPSDYSANPATADASRTVLDETLLQGHGLATGDILGTGSDQIVVGWRGNKPGDKVGIKLFAPGTQPGSWRLAGLVDDNGMACEDLKVADLNGDGRPEIIAAGRATRNVVIYWNETPQTTLNRK